MKKQVIIIFGPPGAGKGTQAGLLSEKLGIYHLESSKVIEKCFSNENPDKVFEIDGKKYKLAEEIENWKTGILTSPPFVTFLMSQEIEKLAERAESFIMSGSPRTIYEVENEMPVLEKLYGKVGIKILMLEITPEATIFRNSHRKICELMRHPILFSKETEKLTVCPLDGSKLVKREGLDDPESIKVRIKEYEERTLPMVEYFNKNNFNLHRINGEQTVADVFKDVLKAIE